MSEAQGIPGVVLSPQTQTINQPAPIIQQELLKWLSTPDEVFIWIEHSLRGDSLKGQDENGNDIWETHEDQRQMNEYGIHQVISRLRPYVNKFNFHADYTEDEIREIVLNIAIDFRLWFMRGWRSFGVSENDFHSGVIAGGIINMIYSAYKMSGMRQFYSSVLSINNPGQPMPQQQGKKVLGILPWPF